MMSCMDNMAGMGWMMGVMGLAAALLMVVLLLTVVALIKYLRQR